MPWRKDKTYAIRELGITREAVAENLNIFYTKVDDRGRVNDDKSLNTNIEVWLEFGPITVVHGKLDLRH